jgi:hypothetical protein
MKKLMLSLLTISVFSHAATAKPPVNPIEKIKQFVTQSSDGRISRSMAIIAEVLHKAAKEKDPFGDTILDNETLLDLEKQCIEQHTYPDILRLILRLKKTAPNEPICEGHIYSANNKRMSVPVTPLDAAVANQKIDFIKPLIEAGADPKQCRTDLFDRAMRSNNSSLIYELAKNDITVTNDEVLKKAWFTGKTLLTCRALLAAGANPHVLDKDLLQIIKKQPELAMLLVQYGASFGQEHYDAASKMHYQYNGKTNGPGDSILKAMHAQAPERCDEYCKIWEAARKQAVTSSEQPLPTSTPLVDQTTPEPSTTQTASSEGWLHWAARVGTFGYYGSSK